jgi:flagellar assembly protein FliH
MAIKIVKPGSDLLIQPLDFSDPMPDPQRTHSPVAISERAQAAVPAAPDLAQIERNAYENGFHQGERAGMEMAEKKLEVVMRRYAEAVLELGKAKARLYAEVEPQVVKLAIEVARRIVHREIHADREIIQTLVKVALNHATEKSAVTVHLNPTDYSYLLEHRNQLAGPDDSGREVILLADKAIERGGCLVKTECGDIDARIEEEFRELERGFFEGTAARR